MAHIKIDAPEGFIYRYKGAKDEFARTVLLGGGRTIEDYELITDAEYEAIIAEREEEVV